jgi:hypothetical protein
VVISVVSPVDFHDVTQVDSAGEVVITDDRTVGDVSLELLAADCNVDASSAEEANTISSGLQSRV